MNIAIVTRYKNFPAGDFPGGDETIHRQIALIFEELGHHVDIIGLDAVIESGKISFYEKIFSQRIFLLGPCVIGRFFKTIQDRYDIVLANGEYGAFINHSRTFVLYHFSSLGYTKQLFSLKYFWKKKFSLRLISQMIYFSRRKKLEV